MKVNRYITACREAGLGPDSLLHEIEDVIFDLMEADGFGYGYGYTADDVDRDEALDRAHAVARQIDGLL
jgi:hypothetical protein